MSRVCTFANYHINKLSNCHTLPLRALNTQAIAKKPMPTAPNPKPATSLYLKAPKAISPKPTTIIMRVAHPNTAFLFIIMITSIGYQ